MLTMALAQTDNLYAQVLELWKMYSRKWAALSIELALYSGFVESGAIIVRIH